MDKRNFKCSDCDFNWEVEYGIPRPSECPKCGSTNIHREDVEGQRSNRRRGRQGNRSYGRDRN
jgi:transposase-like protein